MQSLTKRGHCIRDVASYKSLTERWGKLRSLRTWWTNIAEDAQTDWYRRQQALKPGSKRSFDEVNYTEQVENKVGAQRRSSDHFQPWWLYKQSGLSAGEKHGHRRSVEVCNREQNC